MQKRILQALMASWLSNNKFVLLDTETTGLKEHDEIVEISIIDMAGNTLLDTLVRPTIPIPSEATEINGITNEMVSTAPTWLDVYPLVMAVLRGRKFIAWRAEFDARMITQTSSIYGIYNKLSPADAIREYKAVHDNYIDGQEVYSMWVGEEEKDRPGFRRQRLQNAIKQMNVIVSGSAHRSLADCHGMHGVLMTATMEVSTVKIGKQFYYDSEEGEGVGHPDDCCSNLSVGDCFSLWEAIDVQEVEFEVELNPAEPGKLYARRLTPEVVVHVEVQKTP
jgi:DNA polymerase-3 subunit epsilon